MQTTYKKAGVNIDAGNALVEAIKPHVQQTTQPNTQGILGSFGGMCDLSKLNYKDPLLISTTDGVGTKLKIAHAVHQHTTIGIDLVAMCVNDLLVHGAQPLFFLDYFATSKLNVQTATNVIKGIVEGCKQAECTLSGGETAEMPGMYKKNDYDLAGFAVGIVEREQVLPKKERIQPGDVVIGFPSSGLHSNGFSLVRYLLEKHNIDLFTAPPFESSHDYLHQALLEPTKIYVQELLPVVKHIKALAHITGGGLLENIPRVLPDTVSVQLNTALWHPHPIFAWLKKLGTIDDHEMLRTFNMGIGMIAITTKDNAYALLDHHKSASIIGNVIPHAQQSVIIH